MGMVISGAILLFLGIVAMFLVNGAHTDCKEIISNLSDDEIKVRVEIQQFRINGISDCFLGAKQFLLEEYIERNLGVE